jgi:hypothetical protein
MGNLSQVPNSQKPVGRIGQEMRSMSVLQMNEYKPSFPNTSSEESSDEYRPHTLTSLPTMATTCPQCQSVVNPKKFLQKNMRFCFHTGLWYCRSCHSGKKAVLPSQAITNWNLKKFSVCDSSFLALQENESSPIIDMATANPSLYSQREFLGVRKLREKLNLLAEIVLPCTLREVPLTDLFLLRPHLFSSGDFYSLRDLIDLSSGVLEAEMEKFVGVCRVHVIGCDNCRTRGSVCGVCNNYEILYPFETERVGRCIECGHVMHISCQEMLRATQSCCPKCQKYQPSL